MSSPAVVVVPGVFVAVIFEDERPRAVRSRDMATDIREFDAGIYVTPKVDSIIGGSVGIGTKRYSRVGCFTCR